VDRNFCDVEEKSILDLPSTHVRQELHDDAILVSLHREAVAWRRARFATLMAEEPWRALYGRLLMTPATRALGRDEAAAIRALQNESDRSLG